MNKVDKYCSDNTEKSIYEQIADIIKMDISNGKIPLGKQLLPELKLAANFNVSLVTMQRAFKLLADEKLITRSTKKGTFVSKSALRLLKYKNIGLIMPALGAELTLAQSPTNYQIFDGIQKYCLENSWDIQIIQKKYDSFSWEKISRSNISGLIIVLPNKSSYELIADLKKHQVPFLCVNLHSEKINKDVNFVNLDFYNTAIDAIHYLYEKGRRNIGIIGTHKIREDSHFYSIANAYRKTLKTLNLKENIVVSDTEEILAPELVNDFLRNNMQKLKKCDSIITALSADESTALFNTLQEEKISIPEEISIISFFENEESKKAGITSYAPDLQMIGYESVSLLEEVLNDDDKNIKQLKIKLPLFVRSST